MAITPFNIPKELFIHLIFPHLPDQTILSIRLVSKTARRRIFQSMRGPYRDIDLNGKEVSIAFEEKSFLKRASPFFLHKMKMTTLDRYPELLATLESARAAMQKKGKCGPYKIQDFLGCTTEKEMALALAPFDFKTKSLNVKKGPPFITNYGDLPLALIAAAQKNSLGLVNLVLSHPNANDFEQCHLQIALLNICFQNHAPPKTSLVDQRIRLAILSHPNASALKRTEQKYTLAHLEKMLGDSKAQYTLEDYAIVLMQLPEKTILNLQ